jgi:hypothetical protein
MGSTSKQHKTPSLNVNFHCKNWGWLWYSIDLCEDARPSAPTMSYGSRATQAKPDALSSCSEQLPETAFLRETAGLRPYAHEFPHQEIFFRAWDGPCTVAHTGA